MFPAPIDRHTPFIVIQFAIGIRISQSMQTWFCPTIDHRIQRVKGPKQPLSTGDLNGNFLHGSWNIVGSRLDAKQTCSLLIGGYQATSSIIRERNPGAHRSRNLKHFLDLEACRDFRIRCNPRQVFIAATVRNRKFEGLWRDAARPWKISITDLTECRNIAPLLIIEFGGLPRLSRIGDSLPRVV